MTLTPRDLLAYPAPQPEPDERLVTVLEQVGLGRLRDQLGRQAEWSRELSGGEQQRIGLARALLYRPQTLYLDEATNQLDDQAASELLRLLRRELPRCTVIGVSHQVAVQGLFQRALNLLPTPSPQAEAVV